MKTFNEVPIAKGYTDDIAGTLMTVWLNKDDNSWTILATKDKTSCIIGYGKNFKLAELNKHAL